MTYDAIAHEIPALSYEDQLSLLAALAEAIKARIPHKQKAPAAQPDYTDSYPAGYFDLFGSLDDPPFVEPEELPWEQEAEEAVAYGQLREQLAREGTPIGPNDLLIAATARANGATLVTHNTAEFARVPSLAIEDWRE